MTFSDVAFLITIILGIMALGLYFLNRWAEKRYNSQQGVIEKSKTTTTIFVLSKKKMWLKDAKLPKNVTQSLPWFCKLLKMPVIQAKVGNQIMCFLCDGNIFKTIEIKKNHKVELAGLYILDYAGRKNLNDKDKDKNKIKKDKSNKNKDIKSKKIK